VEGLHANVSANGKAGLLLAGVRILGAVIFYSPPTGFKVVKISMVDGGMESDGPQDRI
jgi:hypothetical protein